MADSDLKKLLDEQTKNAKEQSKKQIAQIDQLIEQNVGDKKQQVALLKMQGELKKTQQTLSGDLGKNINDMVDGFSTTVNGMIGQTFGPLGGMVTSLTTGFLKRGKENRDNLTQNELQNENAKVLIEKMGGVKEVSEKQNENAKGLTDISEKMNDNLVAIKESVSGVDDKTPKLDLDRDAAKKGGVGFLMSAEDKVDASDRPDEGSIVDTVLDGVTTAAGVGGGVGGVAGIKALGGKYKAIAGKLTGGVFGKILSKANPYFSAIMMGKDVFDIASAVTDDDIKTSVKKEDIGGLIGGFIGGALGVFGGPAGIALGVGLGNMAGEFIGGAMESPEIVGAIQGVKDSLSSERTVLVDEINVIKEKLKDKNISAEMKALYEEQLKQNNARVKSISDELDSMKVLDEDIKKLDELDKKASKIASERIRLKDQLKVAEENGDSARITMLNNLIKVADKEFEQAEKDYAKQSEELRIKARETTKTLADKSTSFFDKIATEGGFLGSVVSALGLGDALKKGEGKDNYLKGEAEKELAELKADLSEYDSMKINPSVRAGEGSLKFKTRMIKRTNKLIKDKEDELKAMGGLAKGGFIVNKPTYLPNSGIVVGEHGTYSGRGAAYGGIADGGPEAVIPLSSTRAGAFIDPMAQSVAGQVMNRLQMERMSGGAGGMEGASVVTGNDMSSNQVSNNTTVINNPSPIGQTLPDEGRDFVSKVA